MPKIKKESPPGPITFQPMNILLDIADFIGSPDGSAQSTKNVTTFFKTSRMMHGLSQSIYGKKIVRDSSSRTISFLCQSIPKLQENSTQRINSFNTKVDHTASMLAPAALRLSTMSALIMSLFFISLFTLRDRSARQNNLNFLLLDVALLTSILAVATIFIGYPAAWITKKAFTFFEMNDLEKASRHIEGYVQKEKELTTQLEQYSLGK